MRKLPSITQVRATPSLLTNPRPITVALHFDPKDSRALWDLASRHWPDEDDVSMFAKAARATERGLPVVIECTFKEQLDELPSFFIRHGIEPPRIEELKIG